MHILLVHNVHWWSARRRIVREWSCSKMWRWQENWQRRVARFANSRFEVLYSRLLNRTCYREVPGRVHLWGLAPIANKYEAVRVNPSFAFHLVQTRVSQNNWTDIYNVRMTSTMLRANKVIFLRVFFSMLWQSCSPWKYIEHRQHKLINSSSYRGTVFIVLELSLESRETH